MLRRAAVAGAAIVLTTPTTKPAIVRRSADALVSTFPVGLSSPPTLQETAVCLRDFLGRPRMYAGRARAPAARYWRRTGVTLVTAHIPDSPARMPPADPKRPLADGIDSARAPHTPSVTMETLLAVARRPTPIIIGCSDIERRASRAHTHSKGSRCSTSQPA